jgi:hypothetical protein
MLKRREEINIYLTHVCRYYWGRKSPVKMDEISIKIMLKGRK